MKLSSFSVTNYRSITNAHRIQLSNITFLVGANNEGKSNIIRALNLAMNTLIHYRRFQTLRANIRRHSLMVRPRTRRSLDEEYWFERDFPVQLQSRKTSLESLFRLEFELDDDEVQQFRESVGLNLGSALKILVSFGKESLPDVSTLLQGRGGRRLKESIPEVCDFVSSRLMFNHIAAIRTHKDAISVIQEVVNQEFRSIEDDPEYIDANDKIRQMLEPIVENIQNRIAEQLAVFVPNLEGIEIQMEEGSRRYMNGEIAVIVNDGNPTPLETKGDGIKSLAALALLKDRDIPANASIVAIEEPESHLHPAAMHQIRDILYDISDNSQVIVSTHNPIFVDRMNIPANIIIAGGKAVAAKKISDVRDALGVRVSDNLQNAQLAVVVEGASDSRILTALLAEVDDDFSNLIREGVIGFHEMGGAGKLPYHLQVLHSAACDSIAVLDSDDAGQRAICEAIDGGLLETRDAFVCSFDGLAEGEVEDFLEFDVYDDPIRQKFGINLDDRAFRSNKKWSDRLKDVSVKQGVVITPNTLNEIKTAIADCVELAKDRRLRPDRRGPIDRLIARVRELGLLGAV